MAATKNESTHSKGRRKKTSKVNGQAPPNGISVPVEVNGPDGRKMTIDPQSSNLANAADPLEVQALFYRGAAYLAQAFHLIEGAICEVEDIPRIAPNDFGEVQLAHIVGKYGGTEMDNPNGPLGKSTEEKARAYANALAEDSFKEQVISLLKKSRRDHERFLSHFATLNALPMDYEGGGAYISEPDEDSASGNILERMENSFVLLETLRPSARQHEPPSSSPSTAPSKDFLSEAPLPFTTYHPLMLESHFSVLNCLLLLGDFEALVPAFERTARVVAGLEGYPVFLPPRSMAQAEFVEVLERLASGWKYGKMESALVPAGRTSGNGPQVSLREREKSRAPETAEVSSPGNVISSKDTSALPPRPKLHHLASSSSTNAGPSGSSNVYLSRPLASGSGSGSPILDSPQIEADEPYQSTTAPTPRDFRPALEHFRYLLAPIHSRLANSSNNTPLSDPPTSARTQAGSGNGKGKGGKAPLNLVLHGARVEVILAWVGAVHLPELEAAASER